VELPGEQSGGEVLVDHGLDPDQPTPGSLDHRHSASADADHYDAGLHEDPDRVDLNDAAWLGRRNDASPLLTIGGDAEPAFTRESFCVLASVDRPDRL